MDAKTVDAVLRYIDGPLAENPWRVTKRLDPPLERFRSGYVGIAFRVLVQIDDAQRRVTVADVAGRAHVYRTNR